MSKNEGRERERKDKMHCSEQWKKLPIQLAVLGEPKSVLRKMEKISLAFYLSYFVGLSHFFACFSYAMPWRRRSIIVRLFWPRIVLQNINRYCPIRKCKLASQFFFLWRWAQRFFFQSCWPTRDHIGRSTRNSNPAWHLPQVVPRVYQTTGSMHPQPTLPNC